MTKSAPDDCAFPPPYNPDREQDGLTKREFLAALALQGVLANPEHEYRPTVAAVKAVRHADALLAALATVAPVGPSPDPADAGGIDLASAAREGAPEVLEGEAN